MDPEKCGASIVTSRAVDDLVLGLEKVLRAAQARHPEVWVFVCEIKDEISTLARPQRPNSPEMTIPRVWVGLVRDY